MRSRALIVLAIVAAAGGAAWWAIHASSEKGAPSSNPEASGRRDAPSQPHTAPKVETVEDLIGQLASAETRGHAQLRLQDMGAAALPALANALPNAEGPSRDLIVNLITNGQDKTYLPLIVAFFDSTDEESQLLALKGVSQLNATEEKDRVLRIATDSAAPLRLRLLAAEILTKWKASEVVPTLLSWLPPPNETASQRYAIDRDQRLMRSKSVSFLGDIGAHEAIEPLRTLLLGADPSLHSECADALVKMGSEGIDVIEVALALKDPERNYKVIRALGRSPDPRAPALVRPYLADPSESIRRAANDAFKLLSRKKG